MTASRRAACTPPAGTAGWRGTAAASPSLAVRPARNRTLGDTEAAPGGPFHEESGVARTISTFLMFDGAAEEAMKLYVSLFRGSHIARIERYGAG